MNPNLADLHQRRQQLEQAKVQRDQIQARVEMTKECVRVLVEAGQAQTSEQTQPLLTALCKVQLAQLRMAAHEGETMLAGLNEFIKRSENPLFGATLITPNNPPKPRS